jgi:hypothetical protein
MYTPRLPQKDARTEKLRQAIERLAPEAVEDNRAECGLTTLSYSSTVHVDRHVWLDTDLGGALVIDLEDWTYEGSWDNSVAHIETTADLAPSVIRAWLAGATVEECVRHEPHLK